MWFDSTEMLHLQMVHSQRRETTEQGVQIPRQAKVGKQQVHVLGD